MVHTIMSHYHYIVSLQDFRTGMHEYLTKLSYKNASTEDLWTSLGVASGKPVDKVMTTWTKKMGYPVLNVSAKQVCNLPNRFITQYHNHRKEAVAILPSHRLSFVLMVVMSLIRIICGWYRSP